MLKNVRPSEPGLVIDLYNCFSEEDEHYYMKQNVSAKFSILCVSNLENQEQAYITTGYEKHLDLVKMVCEESWQKQTHSFRS